ncbi:LolA family protein [Microscilla marina]|uniref:Putative outer-membrane lipoproteins carrier protein n=1 Tax=Microscilla marina ATCC 23134 TaxID=313606 RepID=A1ZGI6_MICM2|nr:outer membrane lipoprotein carrier protein LolA [Microscilla marina]EAY30603.1 putative outer-membrane lipoproteins carrier protein [Microscilla marina ATCC 23134]
MKLKATIFLLAIGLFTFTNLYAQQDAKAKSILDAVKNRYENLKAFGASFRYSLKSSSGVTDNFNGSITIAKKMFRLKASGQEVMTDGKTQWTYLKETNEANVTEYEPDEGITPDKIYTIYKQGFKYRLLPAESKGTYHSIEMVPQDRKKYQLTKLKLRVKKADNTIMGWETYEKNGNRYLYTILKFIEHKNGISKSYFQFNPKKYPGVELNDLR